MPARTPFPRATLVAVSILVALGGCGLLKTSEDVLAVINNRALGMPVGEFFDRYGAAKSRFPLSDGTTDYEWYSGVAYAKAGPADPAEQVCRLRLSADPRGRIRRVDVLYDPPGLHSTSRCTEIFAAP
jgi:hypothetical protein